MVIGIHEGICWLASSKTSHATLLNTRQLLVDNREDKTVGTLSWLSTADQAQRHATLLQEKQDGTGIWFTDSMEFRKRAHMDQDVLFCVGIPGAGKTFITCQAIEYLHSLVKCKRCPAVCYVYCDYKNREENKLDWRVASFLEQLVRHLDSLPTELEDLFSKHSKNRTRPSITEYFQAFRSIQSSFTLIYLVVDAVDEFSTDKAHRKRMLDTLFNLQRQMMGKVKFLASSRPIDDITTQFMNTKRRVDVRSSR